MRKHLLFIAAVTSQLVAQVARADLYPVMLRPPKEKWEKPWDMRNDPFWMCGSFGLTGCHGKTLLHTKNLEKLVGHQVVFFQGGAGDEYAIKVLYITPPLTTEHHAFVNEIRWNPENSLPFRYADAPIAIAQDGSTDFPKLKAMTDSVARDTAKGRFGSRFRTYSKALPPEVERELLRIYAQKVKAAPASAFASDYTDALPYPPPFPDSKRQHTYDYLKWVANNLGRFHEVDDDGFQGECYRKLIRQKK